MTLSLSVISQPLLNPNRNYRVSEIHATPSLVPQLGGIYAWWFSKMPGDVPHEHAINRDGFILMYVGIAPRRPSIQGSVSKRTLRDRLLNHCRGPIASSTLRRTLAVLLQERLRLNVARRPTGKLAIGPEGEGRLTAWMDENARANWLSHAEPWVIEEYLISNGYPLPLNIRGSSSAFSAELSRRRSQEFEGDPEK